MRRFYNGLLTAVATVVMLSATQDVCAKKSNSESQDIYAFAISLSFSDSIMYTTGIRKIADVTVKDKYFLNERGEYAEQFKKWLEEGGAPLQVSSLFFYNSRSKAERQFRNVSKRAMKKHECSIVTVPDFQFKKI